MKYRTYLKGSFRDIKNSLGRFLSIVLIIMLGMIIFVGIKTIGPNIKDSAGDALSKSNISELKIVSTAGITKDDIAVAKKNKNAKVESGFEYFSYNSDKKETSKVISYDKKNIQNRLTVIEGHLPKLKTEVVLDSKAKENGYKIGDIYKTDTDIDMDESSFKVVGFVDSPNFVDVRERGSANVGNGNVDFFVYVPIENFTSKIKTTLYVTFDNVNSKEILSQNYLEVMKGNLKEIQKEFKDRSSERYTELKKEANDELEKAQNKISDAESKINNGQTEIDQVKTTISEQEQAINQMPADQQTLLLEKITTAKNEIERKQKELDKNKEEVNNAKQDLEEAKENILVMKKPSYTFTLATDEAGLNTISNLSNQIDQIANIFPVFFFLIAALITFTSMTRMVEENRRELGTLKALGYSKFAISTKYLIYAILASILGIGIGSLIGATVLQEFIVKLILETSIFQKLTNVINWTSITIGGIVFLIACLGSTLIALLGDLKEKPSELLLPKAPKPGKKIFLEYIKPLWSRLSFNQKVSYRNLFRYKSRMIMAIIGIAGCTGLMFSGIGLKSSLESTTSKQYGPIIKYSSLITLKEENSKKVDTILNDLKKVSDHEKIFMESVDVEKSNTSLKSIPLMVFNDNEELSRFIGLKNKSNHTIQMNDSEIVVTEGIFKELDLQKGSKITITASGNGDAKVKVGEESTNYVGNYIYLTKALYQRLFDAEPENNTIILNSKSLSKNEEEQLSEKLLNTDEVLSTMFVSNQISTQKQSTTNLNSIVFIFVGLSAILALAILYNLTNINISERIRELSTIKVLGFFDKEVTMYIVRENIIFTIIGIVFGYGVGYLLTAFILNEVSMLNNIIPLTIGSFSFVLSSFMTIFFTVIVMVITHYKLKNIDMIDALKSNE